LWHQQRCVPRVEIRLRPFAISMAQPPAALTTEYSSTTGPHANTRIFAAAIAACRDDPASRKCLAASPNRTVAQILSRLDQAPPC